jgi:hypothetical protein
MRENHLVELSRLFSLWLLALPGWFGARMRRLPGRLTLDRRSAPS